MTTYHPQTAKFLATVAQSMPEISGEVMQRWVEDPNGLRAALGKALLASLEFRVWRTIKLGTGLKTADDFRKELKTNGFKIGDWANDILGKPAFAAATEEIEVDLVVASVSELGFKGGATREQIYNRAKELGLDLCPAEVGPQLRLQYKDQPNGEWIFVAMEPIADSDGDLRVFGVGRGGDGLGLGSLYGSPGGFWGPGSRWAFSRRK